LSSTVINDANQSEHDQKGGVETFCDLLSRHVAGVGSGMFTDEDAGDFVDVRQMDDSETQNSSDQVSNSSRRLKNPGVEKSFARSKRTVRKHMHTHTVELTYVRCICTKAFLKARSLGLHLKKHMGVRPHKCFICHKEFPEHSNLREHMRTHTGERPYQCEVCHRQFTQRGSLHKHRLIHSDHKPHQCDICHKLFTRQSDVKKHMLLHTYD